MTEIKQKIEKTLLDIKDKPEEKKKNIVKKIKISKTKKPRKPRKKKNKKTQNIVVDLTDIDKQEDKEEKVGMTDEDKKLLQSFEQEVSMISKLQEDKEEKVGMTDEDKKLLQSFEQEVSMISKLQEEEMVRGEEERKEEQRKEEKKRKRKEDNIRKRKQRKKQEAERKKQEDERKKQEKIKKEEEERKVEEEEERKTIKCVKLSYKIILDLEKEEEEFTIQCFNKEQIIYDLIYKNKRLELYENTKKVSISLKKSQNTLIIYPKSYVRPINLNRTDYKIKRINKVPITKIKLNLNNIVYSGSNIIL
jgi:hypothetical protein